MLEVREYTHVEGTWIYTASKSFHDLQLKLVSWVVYEWVQWHRSWGYRGFKRTPKCFNLSKIWDKIANKFGYRCFDTFLTILMKLYLFVIECINKSVLCHKKHIIYIQNEQTVSTVVCGAWWVTDSLQNLGFSAFFSGKAFVINFDYSV